MAKKKNLVISNSIIYSVCGLLLKCISFFLLPLYTAYLTTEDYGVTNISASFINTMVFVVAFSLFSAVMRFYVDLKDDEEKLKRFYGTIVTFVFISGMAFGGVLYIFRDLLCRYVFGGIDFFPVVFVSVISLIFSCQHHIYENILKSQQKALKHAAIVIAYFFLVLILNITFVVKFKMGAFGVILTTMIGNLLYTLFFIGDMIYSKSITFCIDIPLLKESLKYSIPIMPHNLSTHITQLVSKVLIGGVGTFSMLGIYSVASQFANVADTIQTYINNAYGPWLYEELHDKNDGYKKNICTIVEMLCGVIGLAFLGITLFSHDYIVLFIDKAYIGAWKYIPIFVFVFSIKTIYYFYINILFYYKEASKKIFIATLSSSIINVIFSAVMIPLWGGYGSLAADAVAMLIRVIIVVALSKKYESTGLSVMSFVRNFIMVTVFIFGGSALSYTIYQETFSIWNLLYKGFFVAVYVGIYMYKYKGNIIRLLTKKRKRK